MNPKSVVLYISLILIFAIVIFLPIEFESTIKSTYFLKRKKFKLKSGGIKDETQKLILDAICSFNRNCTS
jgi:hypothetical protein